MLEVYNGPKIVSYDKNFCNGNNNVISITKKNQFNTIFNQNYPNTKYFIVDNLNIFDDNNFECDKSFNDRNPIIMININDIDLHMMHIAEQIFRKHRKHFGQFWLVDESIDVPKKKPKNFMNDKIFKMECPLAFKYISQTSEIYNMSNSILLFGCSSYIDLDYENRFTKVSNYDIILGLDPRISKNYNHLNLYETNAKVVGYNINVFDPNYEMEDTVLIGRLSEISAIRVLEHLTINQLQDFPRIIKDNFKISKKLNLTFVVPDYEEVMKYTKNLMLFSTDNHKVNAEIFGYNDWETDSDHKFMWTKSLLNQYVNYFGKNIDRPNTKILKNDLLGINSPAWYRRIHVILKG